MGTFTNLKKPRFFVSQKYRKLLRLFVGASKALRVCSPQTHITKESDLRGNRSSQSAADRMSAADRLRKVLKSENFAPQNFLFMARPTVEPKERFAVDKGSKADPWSDLAPHYRAWAKALRPSRGYGCIFGISRKSPPSSMTP